MGPVNPAYRWAAQAAERNLTMKKKLETLTPGTLFPYAGRDFIVLDEKDGGILVLEHQSQESMPFTSADRDVANMNDFRTSSIREYLNGDYYADLLENGADESNILDLTIDLKATDGTRAYGYDTCKVGLLTLEQYGKYKEIIPLNEDDWWWLATPWTTRWLRSPNTSSATYACYVRTSGASNYNYCSFSYGIRPALVLSSSLLVSVEPDENETAELDAYSTKALANELARRLNVDDA